MGFDIPLQDELDYQLKVIDKLEGQNKISKIKEVLLKTLVIGGSFTKIIGLNYKLVSKGDQVGLVSIAHKVNGNQGQGFGVQWAKTIKGNQYQIFGIQGAKNLEGNQGQGFGVQGAKNIEGKQKQWLGYTFTPEQIKKIENGLNKVKNYLYSWLAGKGKI